MVLWRQPMWGVRIPAALCTLHYYYYCYHFYYYCYHSVLHNTRVPQNSNVCNQVLILPTNHSTLVRVLEALQC